jgi:hypothetical protein
MTDFSAAAATNAEAEDSHDSTAGLGQARKDGAREKRTAGWTVAAVLAPWAVLAFAARLNAAAGDTVADRALGQVDFVHHTDPSFIRAQSLDLEGNPRGNAVAIDAAHTPSAIYVADTNSNRVLAWRDVSSFTNGAAADLVIGAPDFYTGSQGCLRTSTGFCIPQALAVDPSGNLFVSGDHVERFAAPFGQSSPVSGTTFVDDAGLDPWGVAADAHRHQLRGERLQPRGRERRVAVRSLWPRRRCARQSLRCRLGQQPRPRLRPARADRRRHAGDPGRSG